MKKGGYFPSLDVLQRLFYQRKQEIQNEQADESQILQYALKLQCQGLQLALRMEQV